MRVEFNRTGAERKALVTAIAEILGTKPKYMGMPTAAYDFGGLIIDKSGALEFEDNVFPKDFVSACRAWLYNRRQRRKSTCRGSSRRNGYRATGRKYCVGSGSSA